MLDEDQQTTFDLAKDGHNLAIVDFRWLEIQNCKYDVKFVGFLASEENVREKCRPFEKMNIGGDEHYLSNKSWIIYVQREKLLL
jgi:hypothetical protein